MESQAQNIYSCPGLPALSPIWICSTQQTRRVHFMTLNTPPNMELRKAGPAYNDVTGEPWVGKCFWLALTELSYVRVCMKTPLKAAKVMDSPYNSNRHQGSLKDYWNRRHSFVTLMLSFPSRLLNQHLKIWIGSFLCRATIHMKMNTWNNLERQY